MPIPTKAPTPDALQREALCRAAADLDQAEGSGQPYVISQALAQMARCYRGLDAAETAESYLKQALVWGRMTGSVDHTVDLLCELCEAAARVAEQHEAAEETPGAGHAARERARDHAFEATHLAGRVADPRWEIKVLLRISDVLDRCGDRDDAVSLQTRALRLMSGDLAASLPDVATLPGMAGLADG